MRVAPREVFRAAALVLWIAAPQAARADAPAISVVLSDPASTMGEPLLLALRLEFPDTTVEVVDADAAATGLLAVIRVDRTATGLRVRVEETGTHVAVEREILVDDSGDEAAAHAAALLARSLLGVALLYEADGSTRPPAPPSPPPTEAVRPAPERAPVARPPRGAARVSPATSPTDGLFVLSAGAIVSLPFEAEDPGRTGGRLGLAVRAGRLPLEAGLEVAVLGSQDFALDATTTAHYGGTPFGAWARVRLLRRPVEVSPGLGLMLERSTVVGGPREYSDWNGWLGAEGRARLRILGALHLEAGVRGLYGLGGQTYRWRRDRAFGVGGSGWAADIGLSAQVP